MKKKLQSILTSKTILFILSFICILLIAASFFSKSITAPIKQAVSYVVIPVQNGLNNIGVLLYDKSEEFKNVKTLISENDSLKEQIDTLTTENTQLKQDTYELERLRSLYNLDEKFPEYEMVGARIIGSTTNNWYSTFTINKGSNDGIEVNMNVVAGEGLVGIVSETYNNYSIVKSIIEDGTYVSAMTMDTGDLCTVKGDLTQMDSGYIEVEHFKKSATVRNGDRIVTSNISDRYLPGLLIGYAKDVEDDNNDLTLSGYVVPVVDFEHLQEVLIIKTLK